MGIQEDGLFFNSQCYFGNFQKAEMEVYMEISWKFLLEISVICSPVEGGAPGWPSENIY